MLAAAQGKHESWSPIEMNRRTTGTTMSAAAANSDPAAAPAAAATPAAPATTSIVPAKGAGATAAVYASSIADQRIGTHRHGHDYLWGKEESSPKCGPKMTFKSS